MDLPASPARASTSSTTPTAAAAAAATNQHRVKSAVESHPVVPHERPESPRTRSASGRHAPPAPPPPFDVRMLDVLARRAPGTPVRRCSCSVLTKRSKRPAGMPPRGRRALRRDLHWRRTWKGSVAGRLSSSSTERAGQWAMFGAGSVLRALAQQVLRMQHWRRARHPSPPLRLSRATGSAPVGSSRCVH